jgi:predicted ArsR family transcriptional regulator/TusA-related sulfurtransferase
MSTVTVPRPQPPGRLHRLPGAGVTVGKALSSSTRAGIFERLRDVGGELTVRDVATDFELHPNVARTHLELLAEAGLVVVGRRKHPGGGRPAKVYRVREDVDVDLGMAEGQAAAAQGSAAQDLLITLLARLLEEAGGPARERAHEIAVGEGRRLVVAAVDGPQRRDLAEAAGVAVRALLPYAPEARVVKAGSGWVDIAGVQGMFAALGHDRPELADVLERGVLAGALAAAGVPVALGDAGTALGGGVVWRARSTVPSSGRGAIQPTATVDARGRQREQGVVQAMRAVTRLAPGDVLEVLAEGPGSPAAFARWADRAGHQLLGVERATDPSGRPAIRLLIRKGS